MWVYIILKTRHDYINASKVNGGEPMGRQWIVAQGPLNSTVEVNQAIQRIIFDSIIPFVFIMQILEF